MQQDSHPGQWALRVWNALDQKRAEEDDTWAGAAARVDGVEGEERILTPEGGRFFLYRF